MGDKFDEQEQESQSERDRLRVEVERLKVMIAFLEKCRICEGGACGHFIEAEELRDKLLEIKQILKNICYNAYSDDVNLANLALSIIDKE